MVTCIQITHTDTHHIWYTKIYLIKYLYKAIPWHTRVLTGSKRKKTEKKLCQDATKQEST